MSNVAIFHISVALNNNFYKVKISLDTKICRKFVMRCAIWYHLHNLKNVKNTHGGVLILAKLQAEASK